MVKKAFDDNKILKVLEKEDGALSREELAKHFPECHPITVWRRLDVLRKKKRVISFNKANKDYYTSANANPDEKQQEIVKLLPRETLYDVATLVFRGRGLKEIGHITNVDEPLVKEVYSFIQKNKLTRETFPQHVPLPETDLKIYEYLQEHHHGSRIDLLKSVDAKRTELKKSLERLGFFKDIFYVYQKGPGGTTHYFTPEVTLEELLPNVSEKARLRIHEYLTSMNEGKGDLTDLLDFDGNYHASPDNNLSPAQELLNSEREKRTHQKNTLPDEPELPKQPLAAEDFVAESLIDVLSRKYLSREKILALREVAEFVGPGQEKVSLERVIKNLEAKGYCVRERKTHEKKSQRLYTTDLPPRKEQQPSRVYILSEVGYDTAYFNPEAYDTLLNVMAQDTTLSGIIIDGGLTRLERPEVLNDELSYWNKTEEECDRITKEIPNREQYEMMMSKQFEILEKRLKEVHMRVPNAKEIVYCMDSDDLQFTAHAIANERLIRKGHELSTELKDLKAKRKIALGQYRLADRAYNTAVKKGPEVSQHAKERERRLTDLEGIEKEIAENGEERALWREKKARPAHQLQTRKLRQELTERYSKVCENAGVKLVTEQRALTFDNLTIDYAHSRHSTWAVMKTRGRRLVKSAHGKSLETLAREAVAQNVDVIAESGHHGIAYKRTQSIVYHPDATNFKGLSSYDPKIDGKTVTFLIAPPFEDQKKIERFVTGREPERMSGKPMGTRRHAVFDRINNENSVSGITVVTKDKEGNIGTEWREYQSFVNGTVLEQPEEYTAFMASSDEHIGSPEADWMALDGFFSVYKNRVLEPQTFRGKPVRVQGYISGGDTKEANSRKWTYRNHFKRSPRAILEENKHLLTHYKPDADNLEVAIETIMKMTNDTMGGSVEDESVIMDWVADFYERFLDTTLKHSPLHWAHVSVSGNHGIENTKDLGISDPDFFEQRLKGRRVGVYKVREPDYFQPEKRDSARVFLGGNGFVREGQITDYAHDVGGNLNKGFLADVNLLIHHDPGDIIGVGKNVNADLTLAGHTHENELQLYRKGNNQFGVAYRMGTLQGTTSVEKKYANVPRTQGGQYFIMPRPGWFCETFLPAAYLKAEGERALHDDVKWELAQNNKNA